MHYALSSQLINVGAYAAGTDPLLDEAIKLQTGIEAFLRQNIPERSGVQGSLAALEALFILSPTDKSTP